MIKIKRSDAVFKRPTEEAEKDIFISNSSGN
jgi:hypothetical protein